MIRFSLAAFALVAFGSIAAAQPPSGRWSGYWISDVNGHTGPLHVRLRPIDGDTYRATFRGRFRGVIPFWYTTRMHVEGAGDGVAVLSASQRLPLSGEYRTRAVVTDENFDATFHSRNDNGRFVMTRRR